MSGQLFTQYYLTEGIKPTIGQRYSAANTQTFRDRIRREDEAKFGRYRTRDLILAYLNALHAGDTQTVVDL